MKNLPISSIRQHKGAFLVLLALLCLLAALALVMGALTGRMAQVSQASLSGAGEAVQLMLRIGGTLCLWNGLMEVMQRSGLAQKTARLLSPLINLLFGSYAKDPQAKAAIAQNMSANLLNLLGTITLDLSSIV